VANRTKDRAELLARKFQADSVALPALPEVLPMADIVISSTASPLPILGKGMVERALKMRKHRPIFMVDIAVPRDVEPEVGKLDDIYLYTVDDLHSVIEENLKSRQKAADQAEELVDVQVDEFMGWLKSQDALHTVRAYRSKAENISDLVNEQAKRMLRKGRAPEEVIDFLSHTLTNKLLHSPTYNLNQAARNGRNDILSTARELFDLDSDNPDTRTSTR